MRKKKLVSWHKIYMILPHGRQRQGCRISKNIYYMMHIRKQSFPKMWNQRLQVLLSTHSVSCYMTAYTHPIFSIYLTSSHFNAPLSFQYITICISLLLFLCIHLSPLFLTSVFRGRMQVNWTEGVRDKRATTLWSFGSFGMILEP
jgi:hypothetical protein